MEHCAFFRKLNKIFIATSLRKNTKQKLISTDLDVDDASNLRRIIDQDDEIITYHGDELRRIPYKFDINNDTKDPRLIFISCYFMFFIRTFKLKISDTAQWNTRTTTCPGLLFEKTNKHSKITFNQFEYEDCLYVCSSFKDVAVLVHRFSRHKEAWIIEKPAVTKALRSHRNETLICYDCETVQRPNSLKHECYLLACKTVFNSPFQYYDENDNEVMPTEECIIFKNYDFEDKKAVGLQFASYVQNVANRLKATTDIRIFGYNNDKFDNNFIIEEFIQLGYNMTFSHRNGRLTSGSFTCFQSKLFNFKIFFSDLRKWIPDMSLAQACDDYDVTPKKLDIVDIVSFNKTILTTVPNIVDEDNFKVALKVKSGMKWIMAKKKYSKTISDEPCVYMTKQTDEEGIVEYIKHEGYDVRRLIEDYCVLDVQSTFALFIEVKKSVASFYEYIKEHYEIDLPSNNFMRYISAPEMSGKLLLNFLSKDNQFVLKFKDAQMAKAIYSTYFGGRVNYGCLGEYNAVGRIRYMDVTSEYPLVMTGYFPSFISQVIDDNIKVGYEVDLVELQILLDEIRSGVQNMIKTKTFDWTIFTSLDRVSFFCHAYVKPPADSPIVSQYAPIPSRLVDSQNIQYQHTEHKDRFINNIQCKNLILAGYNIRLKKNSQNIRFLHTTRLFNGFIGQMGSMKAKAKEDNNKSLAKLIKLLMNSIAGKLAQKPVHTISVYSVENALRKRETFEEEAWGSSLHYLASTVTAHANWLIYSTLILSSITWDINDGK